MGKLRAKRGWRGPAFWKRPPPCPRRPLSKDQDQVESPPPENAGRGGKFTKADLQGHSHSPKLSSPVPRGQAVCQ